MVDPFIAAAFFFVLILALPIALLSLLFSIVTKRSRNSGRDMGLAFLFAILFSVFWLFFGTLVLAPLFPALFNDKTGRDLLPWLWQWSLILSPVVGAIIGLAISVRLGRKPPVAPVAFDRSDPPALRG